MNRISSWSITRLHDFEKCAFYAWLKHAERIPDPRPKPAADRGTAIHQLAEDYLRGKLKALPPELAKFADEFASLHKQRDKLMLEEEWGFDRDWKPTEYKGAYGRVKLDCCVEKKPTHGVVIDFKTGKKFGNEIKHGEQVQLYTLAAFIRHPEWQEVTAELWYLDIDDMSSVTIDRNRALSRYLKVFDARIRKMTEAIEYPANPNILSCKYCPYGDTGHCDLRVVDEKATSNHFKRLRTR